jgi:hypothetical protein
MIIKGKTQKSLNGFDTESAPPDTNWSWSDSGWTKQGLAKLWFTDTFLPYIGPHRPQLLVLDGHDSHNFLELIEIAIENQIHIVEMPSHTSNWLQPCDRTLFKPLKDKYREVAQDLMSSFSGVVTNRANFTGLFATAWERAITPATIISGFRSCGIFPFNPDAVSPLAYLPNYLHSMSEIMADPTLADITSTTTESEIIANLTTTPMTTESEITANLTTAPVITEPYAAASCSSGIVSTFSLSARDALDAVESGLDPMQLNAYRYLHSNGHQIATDATFTVWRSLVLALESGGTVDFCCLPQQVHLLNECSDEIGSLLHDNDNSGPTENFCFTPLNQLSTQYIDQPPTQCSVVNQPPSASADQPQTADQPQSTDQPPTSCADQPQSANWPQSADEPPTSPPTFSADQPQSTDQPPTSCADQPQSADQPPTSSADQLPTSPPTLSACQPQSADQLLTSPPTASADKTQCATNQPFAIDMSPTQCVTTKFPPSRPTSFPFANSSYPGKCFSLCARQSKPHFSLCMLFDNDLIIILILYTPLLFYPWAYVLNEINSHKSILGSQVPLQ